MPLPSSIRALSHSEGEKNQRLPGTLHGAPCVEITVGTTDLKKPRQEVHLFRGLDLVPVLGGFTCLSEPSLQTETLEPSVICGMAGNNHYFRVLIMCLITVSYPNLHQDNVIDWL